MARLSLHMSKYHIVIVGDILPRLISFPEYRFCTEPDAAVLGISSGFSLFAKRLVVTCT